MSLATLRKKLPPKPKALDGAVGLPRVVIIDDDSQVLHALRVVLQHDYQVETSNNPDDCVRLVANIDPSVVIVDVKMPIHDGFWVFREIRNINAKVPIIFNSAYQALMAQDDAQASFRPFAWIEKGDAGEFLIRVAEAVKWYADQRGGGA